MMEDILQKDVEQMKAQTKAIVASVMVIALALAAVSGVTYSWFSDSDDGKIDISTAKIDVSFDIEATVTDTSGHLITVPYDTTVDVNSTDNSIDVENLMANRSIKATLELTNSSTVTIGYRMYLDASELTTISQYMTFFVSDDGTDYTPISSNQGISFVKGSDTTLVIDDDFCNATIDPDTGEVTAAATKTIYVKIDVSSLAPSITEDGTINVILEAYQHDAMVDTVEPSTPVSIGSGVTVNASLGNEYGIDNGSSPSDIESASIKFDNQALTNIGGSELKVSFEQSPSPAFQLTEVGTINITLEKEGNPVSILGGIAIITLVFDGNVSNPSILYVNGGTTEQMTIVSSTFDGNNTTISFMTNHFSTFIIVDAAAKIGETYYKTLTDAIEQCDNNKMTEIKLILGKEYMIPSNAQNKMISFTGVDGTVIKMDGSVGENKPDYSLQGSTVKFHNLEVRNPTPNKDFLGYAHIISAIYEDCTISGKHTLYGPSNFYNCIFENTGDYNIWTWGASEVVMDDCKFYCNGKSVLLYGQQTTTLTITNSVFNDSTDGTADSKKAAVEIGDDYKQTYFLNLSNNVINGFQINETGYITNTSAWANKNNMDHEHLSVTIDGIKVY